MDPDELSDEERVGRWHELVYALDNTENMLLRVLRTVVSEAFGKK